MSFNFKVVAYTPTDDEYGYGTGGSVAKEFNSAKRFIQSKIRNMQKRGYFQGVSYFRIEVQETLVGNRKTSYSLDA